MKQTSETPQHSLCSNPLRTHSASTDADRQAASSLYTERHSCEEVRNCYNSLVMQTVPREEIKYYYVVYVLGNHYIKPMAFRANTGREGENNTW